MVPARSPFLITAPTPSVRCYELAVVLPRLRSTTDRTPRPWLKLSANIDTEEVTCAAGIRVERKAER